MAIGIARGADIVRVHDVEAMLRVTRMTDAIVRHQEEMPEEYDNDLLREGILHFKAKEFPLARRYFERALDSADDLQTQAEANYYLSQVDRRPQAEAPVPRRNPCC